jgi:hypothetical protein
MSKFIIPEDIFLKSDAQYKHHKELSENNYHYYYDLVRRDGVIKFETIEHKSKPAG